MYLYFTLSFNTCSHRCFSVFPHYHLPRNLFKHFPSNRCLPAHPDVLIPRMYLFMYWSPPKSHKQTIILIFFTLLRTSFQPFGSDASHIENVWCVCVCVCVWERERESVCVRERKCVCMCVCIWERRRKGFAVHEWLLQFHGTQRMSQCFYYLVRLSRREH